MALIETNWNPTSRQLRQFGGLCLVLLPLLAWLWSVNSLGIAIFAGIGLFIGFTAYIFPQAVLPCYLGSMFIAAPIGRMVGEFLLFLIFLAIFLPIGIIFRWTSRDRLRLKFDRQANSYWAPKRPPKSIVTYYQQS